MAAQNDIMLNGAPYELAEPCSVSRLLELLNMKGKPVVVEHNGAALLPQDFFPGDGFSRRPGGNCLHRRRRLGFRFLEQSFPIRHRHAIHPRHVSHPCQPSGGRRSSGAPRLRCEGTGGKQPGCRSQIRTGGDTPRRRGHDQGDGRRQRHVTGRRRAVHQTARHQQTFFPGGAFEITHLGFRGEALPSIASVSRFKLCTRQQQDLEGWEIRIDGGLEHEPRSSGVSPGTAIEVADLFYNTQRAASSSNPQKRKLPMWSTRYACMPWLIPKYGLPINGTTSLF